MLTSVRGWALGAIVILTIGWPLNARSQTIRNSQSVLTVKGKPGGASLSPDGATMVYVGPDDALHLVKIASRQDNVFLRGGSSRNRFSGLSFAPDGQRVAFATSGDTDYYPSDIYSVKIDGTNLTRLTETGAARAAGKPLEYFSTPQYSPDGSRILIRHEQRAALTTYVDWAEVIASDGSRTRVAEGRPLSWSVSGTAIFVTRENQVFHVDLATRASALVFGVNEPIFGKLAGRDVFAVADGFTVGFTEVLGASATAPTPSPFPIRKALDGSVAIGRIDDLRLVATQFDNTGDRVLLSYRSRQEETFEVVNVR